MRQGGRDNPCPTAPAPVRRLRWQLSTAPRCSQGGQQLTAAPTFFFFFLGAEQTWQRPPPTRLLPEAFRTLLHPPPPSLPICWSPTISSFHPHPFAQGLTLAHDTVLHACTTRSSDPVPPPSCTIITCYCVECSINNQPHQSIDSQPARRSGRGGKKKE